VPAVPGWRANLAWLHVLQGRVPEAREEFEELLAGGTGRIPIGPSWPATMAILAELCAALDDPDRAEQLREALLPYVGWCAVIPTGLGCVGSLAHFLGLLATVLGDWKEAGDHFRRALATHRRLGSPPLAARTQLEHARMLRILGPSGARSQADELLTAAETTARRLGMLPLLGQAEALRAIPSG
jgi:tetratricopeptide (TPR) repeat protein